MLKMVSFSKGVEDERPVILRKDLHCHSIFYNKNGNFKDSPLHFGNKCFFSFILKYMLALLKSELFLKILIKNIHYSLLLHYFQGKFSISISNTIFLKCIPYAHLVKIWLLILKGKDSQQNKQPPKELISCLLIISVMQILMFTVIPKKKMQSLPLVLRVTVKNIL